MYNFWFFMQKFSSTGCSDWKSSKVNICRTETVNYWPFVAKAKMRSRSWKFFNFQLFAIFSSLQFFKNFTTFKTHLALSTLGQKCIVSVWQPFTLDNFQSDNPIIQELQTIGVQILSTSIYDLVLIYVCHFHHHFLLLTVIQIWPLSIYSCFYLGSLHPSNFTYNKTSLIIY